jgi:hypothetical protein
VLGVRGALRFRLEVEPRFGYGLHEATAARWSDLGQGILQVHAGKTGRIASSTFWRRSLTISRSGASPKDDHPTAH